MSAELLIVSAIVVVAVGLFITEVWRIDLVALLVMAVLLVSGIVTPEEGFRGFSNEATVTVAAMFVISDGLRRTGALNVVGDVLGKMFAAGERRGLVGMMVAVAILSAFVNNTAVVAIMLPTVLAVCRRHSISPTRVLMPLSFAAMFGGLCTLIGTSTNLLVSSIISDHGLERIGMFEMATLGLVFFVVGTVYMLTVGRWLVPDRGAESGLPEKWHVDHYVAEVEFTEESGVCGSTLGEAKIRDSVLTPLAVVRDDEVIRSPGDEFPLRTGDVVRVRGSAESLRRLDDRRGVVIHPGTEGRAQRDRNGRHELFEAVVAPDSVLVGSTLEEVHFDGRFAADVLALRRRGQLFHARLMTEPLRGGDVLLMEAPPSDIARLHRHPAFVVVSDAGLPSFQTNLMVPAISIIVAVVTLAALDVLPIVVTASAGAVLMVVLGILNLSEAYRAIDWQVIFLLGGILTLGFALEKAGGVHVASSFVTNQLGEWGPIALLAAFYLATSLFTDMMSNQATAVLLTPIALDAAASAGVDPRAFVLAIAFAASASFASPVGYQTNTLIYGAGDYRYFDFVKVGLPLNLIFWGLAVLLLPLFWPL